MKQIYGLRDRDAGVNVALLRTYQELAELSEAVMSNLSTRELAGELADLLAWVCSLANLLDIDLNGAFLAKYGRGCSRCHSSPCIC
ncbi:MAG: MazG nucleotide pyrophosphohydrolase domain-containing protein [Candidatus Thorarchaeota archaeon]